MTPSESGQTVVGGRRCAAANREHLAAEDVAAAHHVPFLGQKEFEGGHPAWVGSFGKLLMVGREAAGRHPLVELADGGNGVLHVGQNLEGHQAPRLAETMRARLPTVFAWSISSGKN